MVSTYTYIYINYVLLILLIGNIPQRRYVATEHKSPKHVAWWYRTFYTYITKIKRNNGLCAPSVKAHPRSTDHNRQRITLAEAFSNNMAGGMKVDVAELAGIIAEGPLYGE